MCDSQPEARGQTIIWRCWDISGIWENIYLNVQMMLFVNECSEMLINSSGHLTSAPISVNVNPLRWHICCRTSRLTLLYPRLMCTAGADGVYTLTNTHTQTCMNTHVADTHTHRPLFVFSFKRVEVSWDGAGGWRSGQMVLQGEINQYTVLGCRLHRGMRPFWMPD